jgi:ribosome-associated translation inhibitor RaiA
MKLTVQHLDMRSTNVVDTLVEERILALQPRLQIDEANIRLEHHRDLSPPFRVHLHLVTPGPDVIVEGSEHTIRAAIEKAMLQVERRLRYRSDRRKQRIKSNVMTRNG